MPSVAGNTPQVVVLGAGLVGRLCAWQLAQAGLRVAVCERGGPDGSLAAAHVAAAMLAPLAESVVSEPYIAELGLASLALWPQWLTALPQPVFFQQEGTLLVWHAQDRGEFTLFQRRLQRNAPAGTAGHVRELDAAALASMEPLLAGRFAQGLYLAGEGQLDNRMLLTALLAALEQTGVRCHWHTEATPEQMRETYPGAWLLDCRGLGAKPQWPVMHALRGVRGEVLRVHAPDVTLRRPVRLLHPRYPLYVAPKPEGVFVVGATEIESEDMSPASVRSALELLSALHSLHPAFGEARILELRSQCRPTLPDHRPQIDWDGQRTIAVNGLYRHGYLLAPVVTQQACALLQACLGGELSASAWAAWQQAQRWPALFDMAAGAMLHTSTPAVGVGPLSLAV